MEISKGEMTAGEHAIFFSTEGIAAGLYLVVVDDGTTKQVKKAGDPALAIKRQSASPVLNFP
jgi:hypothetical protein